MAKPALQLTKEDFRQFQDLLKAGIIKPIDEKRLQQIERDGIVSFSCCDGHHFDDGREHIKKVFGGKCPVHPPALPGGPILLSHPAMIAHRQTAIWAIATMIKKKGAQTVGLCNHAPCALALDLALDFHALVEGLTEAKKILRVGLETLCSTDEELVAIIGRQAANLTILRFIQVDRTAHGKHEGTYFVDNHLNGHQHQ